MSGLDQGNRTPDGPKLSPEDNVERRSETIASIKRESPDPKEDGIRDVYVQQLAFLIGRAEDREVVTLFLDRMAKDGNPG